MSAFLPYALYVLVVTAILSAYPRILASTLYEDQQGATSWLKQFLGDVQSANIAENEDWLLAYSKSGLAAINTYDGTLRWRQELEVHSMHAYDSKGCIVTVTGPEIQMWSQISGQLIWGTGNRPDDQVKATCRNHDALVSIQSGNVTCNEVDDGRLRWSNAIEEGAAHAAFCAAFRRSVVVAFIMREEQKVLLVTYDVQSGVKDTSIRVDVHMPLSSQAFLLHGSLMMVTADMDNICSVELGQHTSLCTPFPLKASGNPVIMASEGATFVNIPVESGNQSFIILPLPTPVFHPLPSFVAAVSSSFMFHQTSAIMVLSEVESSHNLHALILNASTGQDMHSILIQEYPAVHADGTISQPVQVWVRSSQDVKAPIQFLLKAEDLSLWFCSGGTWRWGRDEALSEVVEMTMLDASHPSRARVPLASDGNAPFPIQTDGSHQDMGRRGHGSSFVKQAHSVINKHLSNHFSTISKVQSEEKILVAACRNGLFYALDAGSGRRIWVKGIQRGMDFVAMETCSGWNTSTTSQLLVVLSGNSDSVAILLNARTGFLNHVQPIPRRITHVHSIGRGQSDHFGYFMSEATIPFPKTMSVHMFPINNVEMYPQQTTLWVPDKESGQLAGYQILPGESGSSETAVAEQTWTFSVRSKILDAVSVTHSAQSGHHVKVHGDRSMSFRYLNPNMALLVSENESGLSSPGLTVSILDTVSGSLLHSQFHASASGPVTSTLYDNVAIVHFYDMRTSRWQMTVLELYDVSSSGPSTWQMFWGTVRGHMKGSAIATATEPALLKVTRASIFPRMGVRLVHPIQTRFGVTPKHLLLATFTNQVYNLDSKLLDPDRIKLSRSSSRHHAQGMMSTVQLGLSPQLFATYDKAIASLRSLRTAPSQLESTVHLMAWGSDLYFATLRPSNGFDTLGEDFSFSLLLFAMAGMTAAVITMSHAVKSTRMRTRWE